MKRILSLIFCCVILLGLFSGCKSDSSAYNPTGDALAMEDGSPMKEPVKKKKNQELTLTYYPDVTMNPLACTDYTNRALFSLIYQGLFATDRDYNTVPMLCKTYTRAQDMRSYTFYLENATFSDGSAVTAEDVVATYLAAKESAYYKGRFTHITDILASEDGGITFLLATPMENLPILLDIPILKAAEVAAEHPLGTGPYYFDASGNGILRRRANWWCKADMVVTADAISLVKAESNPQIRDNFEFFDLDLVCANPGSDNYTDYRCDYELWDSENGGFLYLTCNMDSEIFQNEEIRSSLTFAIDRETIAAENYRGFGLPASLPASPFSPYYSEIQAEKYAYDGGEKFRMAVEGSGMLGKELTLLVNSDDTMRERIARTIGEDLTNAGFVVIIKAINGDAYRYALRMREYDLYLGQTRLSPNMDLSAFFDTYGSLSYGAINDVGLFALCAESLANQGNYYSLHQAVMDDGRLCPILFTGYAVYATRGLITDLTPARDNIFYYSLGKTMTDALTPA